EVNSGFYREAIPRRLDASGRFCRPPRPCPEPWQDDKPVLIVAFADNAADLQAAPTIETRHTTYMTGQ
ncbi:MAG: hypothetical protein M3Q71_21270, partial [Chloroflexota bacterium]|nr:hypothetical protein [Chloroflexota bacterium]